MSAQSRPATTRTMTAIALCIVLGLTVAASPAEAQPCPPSGSSGGSSYGSSGGYSYDGGGSGDGGGSSSSGGMYIDTNNDGITDRWTDSSTGWGSEIRGDNAYYGDYNASDDGRGDTSSSSSGSGSKVICTWFYQRGELDEMLYFADIESAKHLIHPATVRGYHAWGLAYVRHLRRNPDGLAAKLIRPVVMHRAREIGYQMGVHDKPDWLGKAFRLLLEPPCFAIGLFVSERDWRSLYSADEFRAFAQGYRRYQAFKDAVTAQ